MRSSPALATWFASLRGRGNLTLFFADCYTWTLRSGAVIRVTSADVPIVLGGYAFTDRGMQVDGLGCESKTGLEPESYEVTITADMLDTINGVTPVLSAMANGAFDGCAVRRERVHFADKIGGTQIGSVVLFQGAVGEIGEIGDLTAKLTVRSELARLDVDMPRNLFQPTCVHTTFDAGCGLTKATYTFTGAAASGSTASVIKWGGASAAYQQGTMLFTSGANANLRRTIRALVSGGLRLAYPLPVVPAIGDTFAATYGDDHTLATCRSRFGNGSRFRGFPYVPPAETAV